MGKGLKEQIADVEAEIRRTRADKALNGGRAKRLEALAVKRETLIQAYAKQLRRENFGGE